jgi:DNA-binding transcriptional MerR regulator
MKSANNKGTKAGSRHKERSRKNCRTIDEVADMLGVNEWTIRLWVHRFSILKPRHDKNGILTFTPADVEKISTIYRLTKEKGMSLKNARQYLETIQK